MKVGAIFPQTECGTDVKAIADFEPRNDARGEPAAPGRALAEGARLASRELW